MKRSLAFTLLVILVAPAAAQDWPSRPVTMVVPFAAGGPMDTVGRILGGRLGEVLGQQVVVENVGGAGGMTGAARIAKATPDGYQFVLGNIGTHAHSQTLYKNPLYNAAADFSPVVLIAELPQVLIARKDLPARASTRRRCNTARAAPARRRTFPACCSTRRSGSMSPTCCIAAAGRRCRT